MSDLKSKKLIVLKGMLFLLIVGLSGAGILSLAPDWRVAVLLVVALWAAARFYYFLFYCLERYVDPRLKYAGIIALVRAIAETRHTDSKH